ncbi:MAG: OsmC family protein [Bernardetiaceae bacterium]
MKITLQRQNAPLHFQATNAAGNTVQIDSNGQGMRPMELLLTALAACATFDVVTILNKQRQTVEDVHVAAKGQRAPEGDVKPFQEIDLLFTVIGQVDPEKAERAVRLAVEKYCSVGASLDPNITVRYRVAINDSSPTSDGSPEAPDA